MKYLYPYECEKRRLSTPQELQAAIDGNRREGRRSSYGNYGGNDVLIQRNPHTPNSALALHAQMSPLSLVTAATGGQHHGPQSLVNGSAVHTPLPHHPHHPQHPQGALGPPANLGKKKLLLKAFFAKLVFFSFILNSISNSMIKIAV